MAQTPRQPPDPSQLTDKEVEVLRDRITSFTLRGADLHAPLHTAGEALAYAERIMRATEINPEAFDREAPFSVADGGDTWIVRSSRTTAPGLVAPRQIVLRKSDAAVLDYWLHPATGSLNAPPASPH